MKVEFVGAQNVPRAEDLSEPEVTGTGQATVSW